MVPSTSSVVRGDRTLMYTLWNLVTVYTWYEQAFCQQKMFRSENHSNIPVCRQHGVAMTTDAHTGNGSDLVCSGCQMINRNGFRELVNVCQCWVSAFPFFLLPLCFICWEQFAYCVLTSAMIRAHKQPVDCSLTVGRGMSSLFPVAPPLWYQAMSDEWLEPGQSILGFLLGVSVWWEVIHTLLVIGFQFRWIGKCQKRHLLASWSHGWCVFAGAFCIL